MKIGIIGIGLIGGSLARAFARHKSGEILIHDRDPAHLGEARRLGLGAHYFTGAADLAAQADIVFVCVPAGAIAGVVREIAPHLKKDAIVTDTGSVKSALIAEIEKFLPPHIAFVPGHPLSGSEHSGPAAGQADLFRDRPYVLIDDGTRREATAKIAALVENIGARVLCLDAEAHDLILAFTSHLPHICAFAAMAASEPASARAGQDVLACSAQSFRDLTRVAASSPDLWKDIFIYNRRHVMEAFRLFRQEADRLMTLIEKADADGLGHFIAHARGLRLRHGDPDGE